MIILAGHTHEKMERTLSLLPENKEKILVFNGDKPFPGAIHTTNLVQGRDVAMFAEALTKTNWQKAYFINDDVEYIDNSFWEAENSDKDIVGVGNLATWIPEHMQTRHTKGQGRELRFIRTSAIFARRYFFFETFKLAGGSAQRFEKSTLRTGSYELLNPLSYYDSNVKEYFNYLKNNS